MVFQAVGSTTSTGGIALESKVERIARNCCCLAFSKVTSGFGNNFGEVKVSGCENFVDKQPRVGASEPQNGHALWWCMGVGWLCRIPKNKNKKQNKIALQNIAFVVYVC